MREDSLDRPITLTTMEQRLAVTIGRERFLAARGAGVANARMGGQDDTKTDRDGAAGELVFARLLNVYPDLTIGPRNGGADSWVGGYGVDVKVSDVPNARMLATLKRTAHDDAIDLYALVVGTFPGPYRLVGWCWREELCSTARIMDLGHGQTYAMAQHELRAPRSLAKLTREERRDDREAEG